MERERQRDSGKNAVHITKKERGNGGKNSNWLGGLVEYHVYWRMPI